MGHAKSRHSSDSKSKIDHWDQLQKSLGSDTVQVVSYTRWSKKYRYAQGYTDHADFTSIRESRKRSGILVKPDTVCGRHFSATIKSKNDIVIMENSRNYSERFRLPHIPGTGPRWIHNAGFNKKTRQCSVLAYNSGTLVVQINTNRYHLVPRFYILDLDFNVVLGHFVIFYYARRWYECYISPNRKRILLRPDSPTRIVSLPDNYLIESMHLNPHVPNNAMSICVIPPIYRAHVLTFNQIAGDDIVIMATGKDLQICSVDTWQVKRSVENVELPCDIQQIKSSPSGDFLAVRCVNPAHAKDYSVNVIALVSYRTLQVLWTIDVCGSYWPFTEVINLQVFPYFSAGEASVSVMKNCACYRKVTTFKLPVVNIQLQCLSRRAILHLVNVKDIPKLPLPKNLLTYIRTGNKKINISKLQRVV